MDLTYRILLIYPLVNKQLAIENCHMTKFIDLPSYIMVDLSSSLCKRLPGRAIYPYPWIRKISNHVPSMVQRGFTDLWDIFSDNSWGNSEEFKHPRQLGARSNPRLWELDR